MKPFDLEAAKRGEPIQTRDGTPVKFIAHVPEAYEGDRVVVLHGQTVCAMSERLVFMVPRKRTVWVNLYQDKTAIYYETVISADKEQVAFMSKPRIGNRAWRLEIEE